MRGVLVRSIELDKFGNHDFLMELDPSLNIVLLSLWVYFLILVFVISIEYNYP